MAERTVRKRQVRAALDGVFGKSKMYDTRKQRVLDKLFPPLRPVKKAA